jgi:urease accessory protein
MKVRSSQRVAFSILGAPRQFDQRNTSMKRPLFTSTLILGALGSAAHAHTGAGPASGLAHGFGHPLAGLDHICAMLAVGLWAAQRGGRAVWAVPLSFVSVMVIGGALGAAGVALPAVEQGIAASVFVLGVLVACAVRMPVVAAGALVGFFALFHGQAHGAEMPASASGFAYGAGFVMATALLHAAGLGTASWIARMGRMRLVRFAGGGIAACGLWLCLVT